MYVITGATGHTGSRIASQLLAAGKKVRVLVRDADKAKSLAALGAEVAIGDIGDAAFLTKAFTGATAAYLLIPPKMDSADFPAYQAAVGEAQVRALREARVPFAIHLSSMGAHTPVGTGVVAGLFWQERRLNRLPETHVLHLRPGYFMENFLASVPMLKHQHILGGPTHPDATMYFIATADIADYATKRFLALDFAGKDIQELIGSRDSTSQEMATILGKAVGKPDTKFVQFPYADALAAFQSFGISASVAQGYVDLNRFLNEGKGVVIQRDKANTTPTSLEAFAETVFKPAYLASA
jgi:uncharacterized protein YbjT (DUF2867 family)